MILATIRVSGVQALTHDYPSIPAGLVGGEVAFAFEDPLWDTLTKTAVFRGCVTRDVLMTGDTVRIPAETVEQRGPRLMVGVYGTDADNNVVTPTLWCSLGTIRDAADPSGDPGTDPDLPIWAQLQERVENLENSSPDGPVEDGEDGGYYTPAVTQPAEDTIQFDWTPSKSDMPAVDPVQVTIPDSGGNADQVSIEPAEDDIPKVFFSGDTSGMTKDNEKVLQFAYKSRTSNFGGYVKMKWQGSSSINFPKKNFTIKMFTDSVCEDKLKKSFKDWGHDENKYVLKANYIDHTHARNVVTANLWSEIVASRSDYDSLPVELRSSPRNGAVDGFPIKLYMNGVYQGIYTWNIGKDDWMFGMDKSNVHHAAICAEKNNNGNESTTDRNILACEFRGNANIDGNDWDLEFPDTLNDSIKASFNNLINCVKDTDDETFKATIGNYLDVTSALDYYILMYFSAAVDNLAKNLIMMTYDGVKWFCSAYDLDNIWGSRGTNTFVDGTFPCPENYQDTNSLLWQRIESCFGVELYARYLEVRSKVLSFENVIDKFERFCDLIGTELYAEDVEIYSGIPYPTQNNLKQIRNFFTARAQYVDECFATIGAEPVPCTGISLDKNTLTFTAEGTQTLTATVTPDGCTDAIRWESNNTSVAMVVGGVVTAIANGSAIITAKCGSYSASCSVAVSGIVEPVPCTGISLDKSEISIDGLGTQTIMATIIPSDTTDTAVWVSSNPAIASITVNGNVCTIQSLKNGSSVVTVTCGEQTAHCSVKVSGIPKQTLYSLETPMTFNGTSDKVVTELALWSSDFDFSIALDLTSDANGNIEAVVLTANDYERPWSGLKFQTHPTQGKYIFALDGTPAITTEIPYNYAGAIKAVISHKTGTNTYELRYQYNGQKYTASATKAFTPHTKNMIIGCDATSATTFARYWKGTINDFKIYGELLADEEIDEYLT